MIIRSKAPLRLGLAGGGSDVSPYSDIYFNPLESNDILHTIKQYLNNADVIREKMRRKGYENIMRFSWEKSAEEFIKIITDNRE